MVSVPSSIVGQEGFVKVCVAAGSTFASIVTTVLKTVQPFKSVILNLYVPAAVAV